ncbi:MAG: NAD(P)/FAD-dependent oxidoreductase [Clostridia bacterium]|nr:NAD(P)/FAD-dependent oxidoreductase [Clostridia bacterium]
MYDVAIIGCGVIGSSIAYRLSRFNLKTVVLEKENDVAMGATRANSAIIHAGYDPAEGTLMAKLNVRSVELTKDLCQKLSVPYAQIGSLVLAFSDEESAHVQRLYERGIANGVPGLKVLTYAETKAIEPNIADNVTCALYAPTAAVINPWEYALALAEVAVVNGVELRLEAAVEAISKTDNGYVITAGGKTIETKYIINAAGTEAGMIHDMALPHTFDILPNKGEYYLLDKSEGTRTNHVVFQCPSKVGKGVLVSPTVHGNLIVGPNAVDCEAGDTSTSAEDLAFVRSMAVKSIPSIDFRQNIRNFAGVRPNSTVDDFIIKAHDGFFDVAGIKSPGLASAAGIAEYVENLMQDNGVVLAEKAEYTDTREQPRFKEMTHEERAAIVAENPLFGRVICRCETITEGEIIDAIHRPIIPRTVDAIKRRCCAGMGRCQGGFCGPRVVEILARELGCSRQDIDKDKTGSYIVRKRED